MTQRWGVRVERLEFERRSDAGGDQFRLSVDELQFDAGSGHVNRLPIMGPSGAGKSTLMNLLAAVVWPQNAGARVTWRFPSHDGRPGEEIGWDRAGPSPERLLELRRRHFGYAFQTATLLPHLTIGENLTFALEAIGYRHRDAVDKAIDRLGRVIGGEKRARDFMSRFDSQISGGERQRISLIKALIHDPCVLFADEPTGSLDPDTRREVMGVLTDWLDERPKQRLLIWVTHHQHDPEENDASLRLYVDQERCRWQRITDAGVWTDRVVLQAGAA